MKLRLAVLATLLVFAGSTSAFAMMYGSPVSSLKAGHLSLGFGYGNQKFDDDNSEISSQQNLAYLQAAIGLGGGWEIYVRGGGGDMDLGPILGTDDLRDTMKPFSGGGFNGRIYDGRVLDIALFGQGNYYTLVPFEDDDTGTNYKLSNFWDASAGVGFEVEIEGAFLYAGPYYYIWQATLEGGGSKVDLKPAQQIGGMAGIRWPLVSGWELDVEGQLADKYVFGAALNYPF